MARYIFTERNGIYIIDLQKTVKKLEEAYNFVNETLLQTAAKSCLLVPKNRLLNSVKEEAERCGMHLCERKMAGWYDDQL